MPRNLWIIDGAYLETSSPGRFDYLRLKNWLEGQLGEPFFDSLYFHSIDGSTTASHESFHTWLKTAPPQGPRLRVKTQSMKEVRVSCPSCGKDFHRKVQKGVDVSIATYMVSSVAKELCDRIVFSAGDGDFEAAVAFARDAGKELWVTGFPDTVSPDLQSYANRMLWLDQAWDAIRRPS